MKGTAKLVKASRIAELAKKLGGVYVVATCDKGLLASDNASKTLAKYEYASYPCGKCSTAFASVKVPGMTPNCHCCGSSKVSASKEVAKVHIHPDAELAYFECAGCGTGNITHIGNYKTRIL